ncbi:MAG: cation:proton antiporter [Acidimicrobiales bacterium]
MPAEVGRGRAIAIYVVLTVGGVVAMWAILSVGHGIRAAQPAVGVVAAVRATRGDEDIVWRVVLAAAVIIVAARVVGGLFQRINQPQVVGEIVAGVVLGPSLLGRVAPSLSDALFAKQMLPFLDVFSQVGLLFFMFLIGLELDLRLIRGRGQAAATVSHMSIVVPFLLGAGLALILFPMLGSQSGRFVPFALFLGASMSITAFPVLARILTERGIYKTRLGAITLTCAAVDDVTAWCMLAVVVAVTKSSGAAGAARTVALAVAFVLAMAFVVRPLLGRLARWHEDRGEIGSSVLAMLFVGILLSALVTDRIGIHAIFGAFLFGVIMPKRSELIAELVGKLEDFTVVFLLPLYFAFTGLRTNIGLLGASPSQWLACLLILGIAIAGKFGGSTIAARLNRLSWRESMAVGVLMNTRGLTELIILNIGLDLKVIPPGLFAMLVIMALVTTFMTTPLLSFLYPADVLDEMIAATEGDDTPEGVNRFTILVPVDRPDRAANLVTIALRLVQDDEEEAQILLLRTVRLPGSAYRAGPSVQESLLARTQRSLIPLVQLVEGAGHRAVPIVLPARRPEDAIIRLAKERQPDLILMKWRRSLWGDRLLTGTVGEVMRSAPGDVATVVDPVDAGFPLDRRSHIVVPYGGGYHEDSGVDLALRLARTSGAQVHLAGPAGEEVQLERLAGRASQAYEDTGVWTESVPVGASPEQELVDHADRADLVVLGVGDRWSADDRSLGGLRHAVAARANAPTLIVRRGGRSSRRQRRPEWIVGPARSALSDADQTADRILP